MTGQRRARVASLLTTTASDAALGVRVAAATRIVLGGAFVGILITSDGILTPVDCGDDRGTLLDEQQISLGVGPTLVAATSATPVVATDLNQPPAGGGRWPLFGAVATEFGIGSVVALPLRAGAAQLGVLTAYRPQRSAPSDDQFADALVLADLVTDLLLAEQAGAGSDEITSVIASGLATQSVVHQAAGMLSEQLGISIIEALVRIRAHATLRGLPLSAVGRSIVAGELELER